MLLTPLPSGWPSWVWIMSREPLTFATTRFPYVLNVWLGSPLITVAWCMISLTCSRVSERWPQLAEKWRAHHSYRSEYPRVLDDGFWTMCTQFIFLSFSSHNVLSRLSEISWCWLEVHFTQAMNLTCRSFILIGVFELWMAVHLSNVSCVSFNYWVIDLQGAYCSFWQSIYSIAVL